MDARQELRQLDKEIQNIHVIVGEEDTADQDFVDAYNMGQINKILCCDQQLQNSKSSPHAYSGASKQLKHSALKLPNISLPAFDGDLNKRFSFCDVSSSNCTM